MNCTGLKHFAGKKALLLFAVWTKPVVAPLPDRCVQLHDDTGDNAGEEPDIIAIFLGTNDYYTYPGTLGSYESISFDALFNRCPNNNTLLFYIGR